MGMEPELCIAYRQKINAVEGAGTSKASASINKSAILPWSGNSNSPSVLQNLKCSQVNGCIINRFLLCIPK